MSESANRLFSDAISKLYPICNSVFPSVWSLVLCGPKDSSKVNYIYHTCIVPTFIEKLFFFFMAQR